MFDPYNYAFQIGVTVKAIFKSSKYELVGIADENFIEKRPFVSMAFVLGNFYNRADNSHKAEIDEFFQKYSLDMDRSISDIGEEKIQRIIENFNNIVATI
jgi:predicted restriction endonuclease